MGFGKALKLTRAAAQLQAAHTPLPPAEIQSPWQVGELEKVVWADITGDADLLPMTRAEAMAVPAIAKGRHVVAPKIASFPLRCFRGTEQLPDPGWTYRTDGPAAGVSPWHRMVWTVDDLIFTGWSLWVGTRGAEGELLSATRVARDRWHWDADYQLVVDDKPLDSTAAILIPGPHEGILAFGRTAIRQASDLMRAAGAAARNPSAHTELHQTGGKPLTLEEKNTLLDDWSAARRGERGGVAFTTPDIDVRDHGSVDAQLLVDGRNAAAVEMARLIGIAAAMVDATVPKSSLTYETIQGRGLEHTEYGIEPYAEAIAARLSMDDVVPRGQRIRFDFGSDLGPVQPTGPTVED